MKRTAAIIVAILMAFTLFFRDSLARGIVKDSALHAFSNAADRIERALESYPNDQYAVMFACNDTQSPILCTAGEGRDIHITYFENSGSGEMEVASVTFKIELRPHLVRGVTEFH